ncbi:unnamed protein product [Bathycoccus prasinos]
MAGVDLAMEGIPRGSGIFKTAAIYVLRKEKRLLTTGQITRYALENDLLGNLPGKTPEATMASACYTDLKKKDVNKRVFARPSEGHFGLREWANDPELTHLLQPKLHRLAETFEEEQKPKVEKPWKQPAPMAKRRNNTAAKKFVDGKPRRDRHGFVHAIIEPSRGEYGPPKMQMPPPQQQYGSLSTHDTMDLDALVDAAANQEDEDDYMNDDNDENDDEDGNGAYNGGNDDHEEEDANTKDQSGVDKSFDNDPNAEEASPSKTNIIRNNNNNNDDDDDNKSEGEREDIAAESEEENKGEEEENAPLVLINPDPNLSNDEYEAHLASLVQQQQEKELRVAKRKEREKERARTQELVKAGLIPAPQSAKKKSSYVPVAYKRDGRGRPRKHFDGIPPAPILSVSANEAEEAPLTNNKKARFTSTAVLHQQQQQQQQQQLQLQQRQRQQQQKDGFEQIQEHQFPSHHQPRAGHDSFVVDTQGVDGISHEEIANESIVAKATRAGMKNWNSKVNKFYSTAFFTEIIDPKLPTSCDPVKQSLNELFASLERLRAQQGNHANVMYSALIYAVACYRSDYPEEATLALSKAWDVYYSLKGGNETNAQNAAFMDKIRKDYEKIVSEALDA